MNGFDTSLLIASFWSVSYVYISTIFAIMTTQIIPKVFSAASFLIMTNCMRQLPRLMFWCLFPQYLHCQSFNAGLRASCLWPFQVSEPKEKSNLHQIEFRRVFFQYMFHLKMPSEMVVALRYTLLTLFTLFTLFKVLYTAQTIACGWNGLMGFWAKCWVMDGVEWMDGYPLGCYDY